MFLNNTVLLLEGTAPFVSPTALRATRKDSSDNEDEVKDVLEATTTDDNVPHQTSRNLSPVNRTLMLHLLLSNCKDNNQMKLKAGIIKEAAKHFECSTKTVTRL